MDPRTPDQLAEAAQVADLRNPNSDRLVPVDVNRTRDCDSFSLETPECFNDLFLRLHDREMLQTREGYESETPEGTSYYVLTKGR
jgi:hypothetical protein